ncbi:hypothetical protein [Bacillus sp. UNCCL81]|uniref:hypothetical protein n=1 Tax=Bacillus sp. UNCCL81 TaxID=1502755 RepID=UPI0008DF3120|nr:hypothetical protein [Bacillus sp. UNCCL81]SFC95852.1 hypothetical protein SAMN02799633_02145 [Bacillus sp. UNCCL81]
MILHTNNDLICSVDDLYKKIINELNKGLTEKDSIVLPLDSWLTVNLEEHKKLVALSVDASILVNKIKKLIIDSIPYKREQLLSFFSFQSLEDISSINSGHDTDYYDGPLHSYQIEILQYLLFSTNDIQRKDNLLQNFTYDNVELDYLIFQNNQERYKNLTVIKRLIKSLANICQIQIFQNMNSENATDFERDKIKTKFLYKKATLRNDTQAVDNFQRHIDLFNFETIKGDTINSKYDKKGSYPLEITTLFAIINNNLTIKLENIRHLKEEIFNLTDFNNVSNVIEIMAEAFNLKNNYLHLMKNKFVDLQSFKQYLYAIIDLEVIQKNLYKIDDDILKLNLLNLGNEEIIKDKLSRFKGTLNIEIQNLHIPTKNQKIRNSNLTFQYIIDNYLLGNNYDLDDFNHFIINNPVLMKPFIKVEENYYLPCYNAVTHNLHYIIHECLEDGGEKLREKECKPAFLEKEIEQLFSEYVSGAKIYTGLIYHQNEDTNNFNENDLLIVYGTYAFLIEAKSDRLLYTAKHENVKDLIGRSINKATKQALNFKSYLKDQVGKKINIKQEIQENKKKYRRDIQVDLSSVKEIFVMNVTFDSWGTISTQLNSLIAANYIVDTEGLGISISVPDLKEALISLSSSTQRIHYIVSRIIFENKYKFFGDERDILANYIKFRLQHNQGIMDRDIYLYGYSLELNISRNEYALQTKIFHPNKAFTSELDVKISKIMDMFVIEAINSDSLLRITDSMKILKMWHTFPSLPNNISTLIHESIKDSPVINKLDTKTSLISTLKNENQNLIINNISFLILIYQNKKINGNKTELLHRRRITKLFDESREDIKNKMRNLGTSECVVLGIDFSSDLNINACKFVFFFDSINNVYEILYL